MSDKLVSLIRTWVPIGVGSVLTWLATELGIVVDDETKTGIVIGATGIVVAVYYAAVRWLERRWPWLGFLLGSRRQPTYGEPQVSTPRASGGAQE